MSTHTKWRCVYSVRPEFVAGQIYSTDEDGFLIDGDGDDRLKPDIYNRDASLFMFVKANLQMVNK